MMSKKQSFSEVVQRATRNSAQRCAAAESEDELGALWDEFWRRNPDAGDLGAATTGFLLPVLRHRGVGRILCVGNGKALEAHALAAAGYQVDSLDISPAANRFLESLSPSPKELERWLLEPCAKKPRLPVIHTGDVNNPTACPGPYDVVIVQRMLPYFLEEKLPRVMELLFERLSETGMLVLLDHNTTETLRASAGWLRERKVPVAWNVCVKDGRAFAPSALSTYLDRHVAWLIMSSG